MDIILVIVAFMAISVLLGAALYLMTTHIFKPLISGLGNSFKYLGDSITNSVLRREKHGSKVYTYDITQTDIAAIASITEHSKNYKVRNNIPLMNFSRFINLLRSNNIHFEIRVQSCDLSNQSCSGMMELTFPSGVPMILEYTQNNSTPAFNSKGKLNYEFVGDEDINDYISTRKDGSKTIQTLWVSRLLYPASIENHSTIYKTIQKIIRESEIESVKPDFVSAKRSAQVFKVARGKFGGLQIERSYSISPEISNEVFDVSYSDFTFNYGGETVKVSPRQAIEVIAQLGMKGLSCFFYGKFGTGKTVLQNVIAAELSEMDLEDPFDILQLNAQHISKLSQMDLEDLLDQYFGDNFQTGKRLFILIDEMETIATAKGSTGHHTEASTTLLNLTDGQLSERYNCVIIGTSNASPSELDPGLFRSGRFEIQLEIAALEADKATKLAKLLSTKEGYVFQMEKFEQLLNNTNRVGNTIMSAAKTITLAEIYSCLVKESLDKTIRKILGLKTEIQVPVVVQSETVVLPPVILPTVTTEVANVAPKKHMLPKGKPSRNRR